MERVILFYLKQKTKQKEQKPITVSTTDTNHKGDFQVPTGHPGLPWKWDSGNSLQEALKTPEELWTLNSVEREEMVCVTN